MVPLQLACARVNSQEGQDYLKGMAAAANYAWVNRSTMTFLTRQAFGKIFNSTPDDLDMQVIYDVSHNIAKIEEHVFFIVITTISLVLWIIYIYIYRSTKQACRENVVVSFFPLKIFIPLCFNVLSTVPRENRLADSLYIYIYIHIYFNF